MKTKICFWMLGILLVFTVWFILSIVIDVQGLAVPSPAKVLVSLYKNYKLHLHNISNTALEAFCGLLISIIISSILIMFVAVFRWFEQFIYPYIVMIKSSPAVAYVPILVLLTGIGYWPKILVSSLISFFPLVIGGIDGLHKTPDKLSIMGLSYGASGWKEFKNIQVGYSVSGFLGGLKTAAPLSVIGAIVGEYVAGGTPTGVGSFILTNYQILNTVDVFSGTLCATLIGLFFFIIAYLICESVNGMLFLKK